MKIVFKYFFSQAGVIYGHSPSLWKTFELVDAPESSIQGFKKYLLSAMETDFPEYRPSFADEVLKGIEQLQKNEIQNCTWEGDGFVHMISRDKVTFEHNIFGECPEWPIWTCTLAQYKAALQGWRQFIDMPKSIDTELIVDLPS